MQLWLVLCCFWTEAVAAVTHQLAPWGQVGTVSSGLVGPGVSGAWHPWARRWGLQGSAGHGGVRRARWARGTGAGGPRGAGLAGAGGGIRLPRQRVGHGSSGALQALAAHVVVLLPVLVLAEGAAVACSVAATTRLAGLAPTVPAALWGSGEVRVLRGAGACPPRPPQTPHGSALARLIADTAARGLVSGERPLGRAGQLFLKSCSSGGAQCGTETGLSQGITVHQQPGLRGPTACCPSRCSATLALLPPVPRRAA